MGSRAPNSRPWPQPWIGRKPAIATGEIPQEGSVVSGLLTDHWLGDALRTDNDVGGIGQVARR